MVGLPLDEAGKNKTNGTLNEKHLVEEPAPTSTNKWAELLSFYAWS